MLLEEKQLDSDLVELLYKCDVWEAASRLAKAVDAVRLM